MGSRNSMSRHRRASGACRTQKTFSRARLSFLLTHSDRTSVRMRVVGENIRVARAHFDRERSQRGRVSIFDRARRNARARLHGARNITWYVAKHVRDHSRPRLSRSRRTSDVGGDSLSLSIAARAKVHGRRGRSAVHSRRRIRPHLGAGRGSEHGRLSRPDARLRIALRVRSTARRTRARRASADGAGFGEGRARLFRRARAHPRRRAGDRARLDGRGAGKDPPRGGRHGVRPSAWRSARGAAQARADPPSLAARSDRRDVCQLSRAREDLQDEVHHASDRSVPVIVWRGIGVAAQRSTGGVRDRARCDALVDHFIESW